MIPYGRQHITSEDIEAVVAVLKSDFLTQGPKVKEFEESIAKYCDAKYAVAFSSGTAALHGAYYAAGIGKGDEVITTPLTFVATANMVVAVGAKPIFADIDSMTGNLDPKKAEGKITKKTKAIVVVDYTGLPADLEAFKKICKKRKLVFIEDAAQALGASYGKKKIGAIADMTMFSFHPVKSITTGEGGIIVTNSKKYFEKLVLFRSHGITKDKKNLLHKNREAWYHEMHDLGFNYRITDIQAALGISQMRKLDVFIEKRKAIAMRYHEALGNIKRFILPKEISGRKSSWHLYVIRIVPEEKHLRDVIFGKLHKAGIGAQVHYIPAYHHPYYESLGYKKGLCPNAEIFSETAISIPIFPSLSLAEQRKIVQHVKRVSPNI
ncbi:MAG: UDP-4-amino-4,6-dideoxy-N-acetyl-beta-L-altrosamine transaminase [Patescibacteria group bacterium]